jgi:hypothetical protein
MRWGGRPWGAAGRSGGRGRLRNSLFFMVCLAIAHSEKFLKQQSMILIVFQETHSVAGNR